MTKKQVDLLEEPKKAAPKKAAVKKVTAKPKKVVAKKPTLEEVAASTTIAKKRTSSKVKLPERDEELEITPESILEQAVPRFFENNRNKLDYTKLANADNKLIKETMGSIDLDVFEFDGVVANLAERVKSGYDQPKLLELIKELGVPGVIKTQEYVDMVAMESAIQGGEIAAEDLLDAITSTTTSVLTVKAVK